MKLKVLRIHDQAKLPCYSHPGDAGLDLFASETCTLKHGQIKAISTGIKIAVPENHVGLIWDKSGISLKGVHRLAGVIDSGYRGEVRVVLVNLGKIPYKIESGMKIAQLLIQPVQQVDVVEMDELNESTRGEAGFGSTGKY